MHLTKVVYLHLSTVKHVSEVTISMLYRNLHQLPIGQM
uniref:Uncharacterized protein n=1 Tax=Arundo donax TaxID=35708 RepID=A0A0A9HUY3_ARUDO